MAAYPALCMIINGERVGAQGRCTHRVVNPATEDVLGELPLATAADLDRALAAAAEGFRIWRGSRMLQRAEVLHGAARLLRARKAEIAAVATLEQGKPLAEARAEVTMCAELFDFYANECQRTLGRDLPRPPGQCSTVTYEPVGPVAAFAPWNFPIGNPGRKLGGPIAAGCSVILKSAEEAPASALMVLQCLLDAGLPPGVAQVIYGIPDEVSRHLLASPIIRKLSFTGSTAVGKHLLKLAADDCKRTTMELGGHGPVLVFGDVDVAQVLATIVPQKFRNSGQVCVSPTRFLVHDSVFAEFRDGFVNLARALKIGNGLDPASQMGPMANLRRIFAMERLVADAVAQGAKLECGGARTGNRGYYFAPTVLSQVPISAQIMNEEPFGPVALINSYADEQLMIAEANRLPYGLAGFLWTNDAAQQKRAGRALEVGMLGINTNRIAGADAPFGGVKWSGHGHEDGTEGLMACLSIKAIHEG